MKNIYEKLFQVQQELAAVKKGQVNPFFNSKYFDINSLLRELKPVLARHNLLLVQPLTSVVGQAGLMTSIIDKDSGEAITESTVLPPLPDPQKMGSAITYYRRYALQSLFALEAEDDDANLASNKTEKPSMVEKEFQKIEDNTDRDPFTSHVPISQEKMCDCGGVMKHKTGTGKSGKKWSGFFCTLDKNHPPIWE